jgi:filamentous hemagglutinin family protein
MFERLSFALACLVAALETTANAPAHAQNITLDGTLGPAGTLTGPTYIIPQAAGTTVGSNLFHSFGRFNLDTGEIAGFTSTPTIRNILARVTGGSRSIIDGLIITQSPNVNLFLINPSGITFGPNAQLSIGGVGRGSFIATTTDALVWPNGAQFSATTPGGAGSLLTIAGDPSGFIAAQRAPASIEVRGSQLNIPSGQSLLLLGGDVVLDNSDLLLDTGSGGRIEFGGMAGAGNVGLSASSNEWSFRFAPATPRADVAIATSSIDVTAVSGGSFSIFARNLDISNSRIQAGIPEGFASNGNRSGDVTFDATGFVNLRNGSSIGNAVSSLSTNAIARSGDVVVTAENLAITGGSVLGTSVLGRGNAGNVRLNIRNQTIVDGENPLNASASVLGSASILGGNAGQLQIDTGSLRASNGGILGSLPFLGFGDSGSVQINAADTVVFDGETSAGAPSGVISSIFLASGSGSDIQINTGALFVRNGAALVTSTLGLGDAGNIVINARDRVEFTGEGRIGNLNVSTANTTVFRGASGKGGDIQISTGSLRVSNGAVLNSSTQGLGDAGSIIINARDSTLFDGSRRDDTPSGAISSVVEGQGKGGDIRISTGSLAVTNGAILSTGSLVGRGDAGNITIAARENVTFSGTTASGRSGGALSSAIFSEIGEGGNIQIEAQTLTVANEAGLFSSSFGRGRSGNLTIWTRDGMLIRNGGALSSLTLGLGDAGNIAIASNGAITLEDGLIAAGSVSVTDALSNLERRGVSLIQLSGTPEQLALLQRLFPPGSGRAGNVDISGRSLTLDQGSSISTESTSGDGGNINLNIDGLLLMRRESSLSTSAGTLELGGTGGNIRINAQFIVGVRGENSDIKANAFVGNGGNIDITTQGIFGLQFRPRLTPFSDITASSEFGVSGVVSINTPDVDPSRGLDILPTNIVDPSQQIAQGCNPSSARRLGSFVVTGRGGLPTDPTNAIMPETIWTDWVTAIGESIPASAGSPNPAPAPTPLQEAQGFLRTPTGEVYLISREPCSG